MDFNTSSFFCFSRLLLKVVYVFTTLSLVVSLNDLDSSHAKEKNLLSASSSCDPLVEDYCMLPFPNNFWRHKTANSEPSDDYYCNPSYRLTFTNMTFPRDKYNRVIDPNVANFNQVDGFGVAPTILT